MMLYCGVLSAQPYHIGDLYTAPDGSQGIVYYLHPDGSGGWVVALNDASTGSKWGEAIDIPELVNQNSTYQQQLLYDTAGYTNTQVLRSYQNNSTIYAAGVVDFEHGWVLPSPAQLSMLHAQLPFINSAIVEAGGTTFEQKIYWCSAEKDATNAWFIFFNFDGESGYFHFTQKTGSLNVRAVRSFSYSDMVYDTSRTYQWNTGSPQYSISVTPSQTTTYTVTVTTEGSCADTAEHTIVVVGTTSSEFEVVSDTPYVWNGVTYSRTGDYTQTFVNAAGCDSVVTLHLTTTFEIPLPDNVFDGDCVLPPEPNAFAMTELFSYPNVNSMSTPMVADMDGDGLPEVLACCNAGGTPYYSAGFHVINGQTGELKYTLNTVQYVNSGQMVTIADVDHDGKSELFLLGSSDHKLYCYNYNGGVRWMSSNVLDNNYLLSAADVNNDGVAEIVCGKYIYDAQTGVLLLQGDMVETGMGFGAPHGVHMPYYHIPYYMYALGDVDGDGTLEVCAGNTIYKMVITNNAGTAGNSWSILRQAETPGINNKDGETFLVDFDNDGDFDVCVIGISHSIEVNTASHTLDVYVWDGQTSQLMAHTTVPVVGKWGASIPYSGDLNGDGYPEIIFAVTNIGMLAYTYDTVTSNFSEMHHYAPFGETAGFTVFDFNQDGQNEIVYRGATQLFIADGITLANLCPPVSALSGTIAEYPVVADVNADGHAEIVITRQGGGNGVVSVFGSAIPGAWSSARKVWNQWAYSSVNINEDMTVPQYRFDVSTTFPNGEKPFNAFLHQMPYIDTQGNLFNPVADVAITGASASSQEDMVMLSINCCNLGDMPMLPYPVTVFANTYGGDILTTVTITESLPVDSCVQQVILMPNSQFCNMQGLEALVVAVNSSGSGIAQNGGLQSECDTTNNVFTIPFHLQHVDPVEQTVSTCDSYEWNGQIYTQSGDYTFIYPMPGGCDSVVILHLTVDHTPQATISVSADTICEGDEVSLQGAAVSATPVFYVPTVAVGDILCTDNSIVKPSDWPVAGKTAMGIVFYVDNTGEHGWAVHLQDQDYGYQWGGYGSDIPNLTNYTMTHDALYDFDGYYNTQVTRNYGNSNVYRTVWMVDFNNGWYVPALGQLNVLVSEILVLNASLQIVNGIPFPMDNNYSYWSSTEYNQNYVWAIFGYGQVRYDLKQNSYYNNHRLRSVRDF